MAQHTYTPINPDVDTGTSLSVNLNSKDQALLTTNSGSTRPASLLAGGLWVKSGVQPGQISLNIYDGTDDIELVVIDTTNNRAIYPGGSDSSNTGWRATTTAGRMEYLAAGSVKAVIQNGLLALNSSSPPAVTLEAEGTDAIKIPSGTTAQRPATAEVGQVRHNSTTDRLEFYDGTAWQSLLRIGDGSGGAALTGILGAIGRLTGSGNKIMRVTGTETADLLNFRDEDNMGSNDVLGVASQQSIKAYNDTTNASTLESAKDYTDQEITAPLEAIKGVTPQANRIIRYTSGTAADLLVYATDSTLAGGSGTINDTPSIKAYVDAKPSGSNPTMSDTAPSSPSNGDLWVKTTDMTLNVYYNDGNTSQWVALTR